MSGGGVAKPPQLSSSVRKIGNSISFRNTQVFITVSENFTVGEALHLAFILQSKISQQIPGENESMSDIKTILYIKNFNKLQYF